MSDTNEAVQTPVVKKPRNYVNITPNEFVTAWETGESARGVAEKLGMNIATCTQRATNYRKKGIQLKKMKGGGVGRAPIDVGSANALIESLRSPAPAETPTE